MRLASRYNGPPGSANGGVTAGRLAAYVGAPAVEVTLRRPPPLDVDLRVDASGGRAALYDGDALVAEAAPSVVDVQPGPPVGVEQAAATRFAGRDRHPFPTCFVCGTERDDGLGLAPGPLGDGRVAAVWTPVDDDPVMTWAALDCPGGWSADLPGRPLVLGQMALHARGPVRPGEPHVVVGWTTGSEGRKVHTATALHAPDGQVLAVARATWLTISVPAG
jgi:hypothetical protein